MDRVALPEGKRFRLLVAHFGIGQSLPRAKGDLTQVGIKAQRRGWTRRNNLLSRLRRSQQIRGYDHRKVYRPQALRHRSGLYHAIR